MYEQPVIVTVSKEELVSEEAVCLIEHCSKGTFWANYCDASLNYCGFGYAG